MGKVTRKCYSAEFKAKVAREAIKGKQTVAELAARHTCHSCGPKRSSRVRRVRSSV